MPDYLKSAFEKAKKKKLEETQKPSADDAFSNQPNSATMAQKLASSQSQVVMGEIGNTPPPKIPDTSASSRPISDRNSSSSNEKVIESFGDALIIQKPGTELLEYVVPVPKPTLGEKTVIDIVKEAATRIISISPYRIRDPQQRRNVYFQKIMEILKNTPELKISPQRYEFYAESVVREMVGYGIIDPLLPDDNIEEIMVIGAQKPVYIFHRKYEMMTTNIAFYSDSEIQNVINKIARDVGRRVDFSTPLLDARLPDGSRVNATIPPASVDQSSLTIRKFRKDPYTLLDLIRINTLDAHTAAFLWVCVEGLGVKPANILISGGTGSGKTTLLNVLSSLIPERERIVTIEDTAELNLPLQHWIRLEARPPGIEGKGELAMDILTKNSLRMRPDRIIVGEVRHAEAATMFTAMNTGHDGMASYDSLVQLSDGSIKELGAFCEDYFNKTPPKKINDMEVAELENGPELVTINKENLAQQTARVKAVWKRAAQKTLAIELSSGSIVKLSPDHPVFRLKNGFLEQIQCKDCEPNDYLCVINSMNIQGKKFDSQYAYFLGLLLGDGHLRRDTLSFENKNKKLHDIFCTLTKNLFDKESKPFNGADGRITSKLHSVKISSEIHEKFGVPYGNKTKIFDIPRLIEESENESIGLFLRGFFDTDGHVAKTRKSVCLATSNLKVAKKIPLLLKRFGIETRLNVQKKDGKNHLGPYYRLFVFGEDNLQKFQHNIGFGHPTKAKTLSSILGVTENTNIDIMPKTGNLIRKARLTLGISKKELALKSGSGKTQSTINSYETQSRNPSRKSLQKINAALISEFNTRIKELAPDSIDALNKKILQSPNKKSIQYAFNFATKFSTIEDLQQKSGLPNKILYYYKRSNSAFDRTKLIKAINEICTEKIQALALIRPLFTHMNAITSNAIRWDRIKHISEKNEKTVYYDLTLDQYNTFVANGVVVSNCMGTIHANSSEETIVRITNPPMDVPPTMLASLDFVIVENRIHDRKKGTIRRITEIAEVRGALTGKPYTHTLFAWNAIKDKIETAEHGSESMLLGERRTKSKTKDIVYFKKLSELTGKNPSEIEEEIEKRAKYLEEIQKRNPNGIFAVRTLTNQFLQ